MNAAIKELLSPLSDDEKVELSQLISYLEEKRSAPLAEGTLSRAINNASPNVRMTMRNLNDTFANPRNAPFQPKLDESAYADIFGLDRDMTSTVRQRLEDEDITSSIQSRMGTDADLPPDSSPPTLKESIASALDAHAGD